MWAWPRRHDLVALTRAGALHHGAPLALVSALALAYLIIAPASGDLAGALHRSQLLSQHGFVLWDGGWYGGHHTLGYSVLFGPAGALLGVRLLGAISVVVATLLFVVLVHREDRQSSIIASLWFALGAGAWLFTGRLAFEVGGAVALAALLATRGSRPWVTLGLAVLTSLVSPVAGAFLALAGVALGITRVRPRGHDIALSAGTLVPIGLLALAFPEGGREPFAPSSFWPALLGLRFLGGVIGPARRELRLGVALYGLACVGAFVVPTPLGGNVVRLGALMGGPIAAIALTRSRPRALAALALPLLYWQLVAPVHDIRTGWRDPSVRAGYYRPLLEYLGRDHSGPFRVEVAFTREKWETYYVAARFPLARGWERQLDIADNPLFYRPGLTAARYRRWLALNAVRYVALPDVALDDSATAEARLIRSGLPYLSEVFRTAHWRVFAVADPRPVAVGPGRISRLGVDDFQLVADHAGTFSVSERFSPYWSVETGAGCVSRAAGGWTEVQALAPGTLRVAIRFSVDRIWSRGRRCSHT